MIDIVGRDLNLEQIVYHSLKVNVAIDIDKRDLEEVGDSSAELQNVRTLHRRGANGRLDLAWIYSCLERGTLDLSIV